MWQHSNNALLRTLIPTVYLATPALRAAARCRRRNRLIDILRLYFISFARKRLTRAGAVSERSEKARGRCNGLVSRRAGAKTLTRRGDGDVGPCREIFLVAAFLGLGVVYVAGVNL